MAKKKQEVEDAQMENVQEALSKSEAFIEKYRKQLIIGVAVVVAIVLAIILFRTYYLVPKNEEAQDAMLPAVQAFEQENFELALRGNDAVDGFETLLDEYSITSSHDVLAHYAGICAYNLGEYDEAIGYLKKVSNGSVNEAPAAKMLMGDCYVETDDLKEAVKCFEKAANKENVLIAPKALKKAGLAYEELGEFDKAVEVYNRIKLEYNNSQEAQDIDKYIARAEAKK